MVEDRKSTRTYNCELTVYKDTNIREGYKIIKIFRHHPLPRNVLPGFRQSGPRVTAGRFGVGGNGGSMCERCTPV